VLCVNSFSVHSPPRVTGNTLLQRGICHYLTPHSAIFTLSMHASGLEEIGSGDSGSYSAERMAEEASLLATRNCKTFLEAPGGPILETCSPLNIHSVYYSIVTLQGIPPEIGERDSLEAMEILSKTLVAVSKRWKVAGTFLPMIEERIILLMI
jgi:hypothetical protein